MGMDPQGLLSNENRVNRNIFWSNCPNSVQVLFDNKIRRKSIEAILEFSPTFRDAGHLIPKMLTGAKRGSAWGKIRV